MYVFSPILILDLEVPQSRNLYAHYMFQDYMIPVKYMLQYHWHYHSNHNLHEAYQMIKQVNCLLQNPHIQISTLQTYRGKSPNDYLLIMMNIHPDGIHLKQDIFLDNHSWHDQSMTIFYIENALN